MTLSTIFPFALGVVGFAVVVPVSASASPAQTVRIGYSDLDLENQKDVRMLARRISRAIEQVCGSYSGVYEMNEIEKIDECRSAARRKVAPQMARLLERTETRVSSTSLSPEQK